MDILPFDHYFLIYLFVDKEHDVKPFSKVLFWVNTLFVIKTGIINIQMRNGHFLTEFDCFMEMEDAWRNIKWEDGFVRAWWEQFQYLRGLREKPYWIE